MSELEKLIEAAKRGDLAAVKRAVESYPELLHERDQSGATALHYATFGGHRSVVGELVRSCATGRTMSGMRRSCLADTITFKSGG